MNISRFKSDVELLSAKAVTHPALRTGQPIPFDGFHVTKLLAIVAMFAVLGLAIGRVFEKLP